MGNDGKLKNEIQEKVIETFNRFAKDVGGQESSQFYTQNSFEIMHESGGKIDYSTTTANADGRTTIYVYFTRNIYTLKFHYYGTQGGSDHSIATATNGYSYGGIYEKENVIKNGELNFAYYISKSLGGQNWANSWTKIKEGEPISVP